MIAAGYLRVSTDEQAEHGISIPSQKSRILSYCNSQGWELYKFYIDDGYSGKDLERPDIKALIRDSESRSFDVVVVIKLDRLSRRQKDVLYLLEDIFEPLNIGFKSVAEPFDTTTSFGKAAIGMMAVFAQLERETIVERVIMAKNEAAKQGRFMGGIPPYGYKHNPVTKSIEIDEITAEVVRMIYAKYLHGDMGYQAITNWLESKKIPAPRAKHWNRSTVLKILTNSVYAGYREHNGVLNEGKHKGIVSIEEWESTHKLISSRQNSTPSKIHSGLISGLIFCTECGARMRTKNVWQNHPCTDPKHITRYYVCYSQDGSTPYMIKYSKCQCGYKVANDIDKLVVDQLMSYSLNTTILFKTSKKLLSNKKTSHAKIMIEKHQKELDTIKGKMDRWYTAFELKSLDPEQLMDRVQELRKKKIYLEEKLEEYKNELEAQDERKLNIELLVKTLKNFKQIWPKATPEERRGIIVNTIKSVHVSKNNDIKIEFITD